MLIAQAMTQSPMHGHVLLERALPLSWCVLPADTPTQASGPAHNHILFNLLDKLEEPVSHKPDADNASELLRIEAKLNVIMQLLGLVLQNKEPLPPAVTLRFTNETLAWQVEQPLPVGSRLQLTLYPDPTIPLGMTFAAQVCGVMERWLEVDMHGLSEDEQAIWSRWVFRQHRRQVAQARFEPSGQPHSK